MTHTQHNVHLVHEDQDSSPFADTVWAVAGTTAAKVAEMVRSKVAAFTWGKPGETLPARLAALKVHVVEDPVLLVGKGLVLVDGHGSSYSTRYAVAGDGIYCMTIGRSLPAGRFGQVVNEILAMIRRGIIVWRESTSSGSVRTEQTAFGMPPKPRKRQPKPDWRLGRRRSRDFAEC